MTQTKYEIPLAWAEEGDVVAKISRLWLDYVYGPDCYNTNLDLQRAVERVVNALFESSTDFDKMMVKAVAVLILMGEERKRHSPPEEGEQGV